MRPRFSEPGFPLARSTLHAAVVLACVGAGTPAEFAAAATTAAQGGAVHVVQNCNDNGPGSLRDATQSLASSGDRIDLSQLSCSTITLTTGAIAFGLDDLAFVGPGAQALSIDGDETSPVFVHVGAGEVLLAGMTIENGYKYSATADAPGGCIYSQGNLVLDGVVVSHCSAAANDGWQAKGGGVFVAGDLTMLESTLSGNRAVGIGESNSIGGGAWVGRDFAMKYSLLRSNGAAIGVGKGSGGNSSAGAAVVYGDTLMRSSAVVGNSARRTGGLDLRGYYATQPASIINSTISSNLSLGVTRSAGIDATVELDISNSTIADNRMTQATDVYPGSAAGVFANAGARIESSILAGNSSSMPGYFMSGVLPDPVPSDLGGHASATITGSHSLVVASTLALPAGTLRADPQLATLSACTGGAHPSSGIYHLPLPASPVIDAGRDLLALDYDQRGEPHRRLLGDAPDMGAVEFDPDRLFASGFEFRCQGLP